MLSLFNPRHSSEAPHTLLCVDDEDAERFFLLAQRPRLAVGQDGRPMIGFVGAGEHGLLNLDTELAPTAEAEETWRHHLRRGALPGPNLIPASILGRAGVIVHGPEAVAEPRLVAPEWLDGEASLEISPPGAELRRRFQIKPSLFGGNRASFAALLEAADLDEMRRSLQAGASPGRVRYRVVCLARLHGIALRLQARRLFEDVDRALERGDLEVAVRYSGAAPDLDDRTLSAAIRATARELWRLRPDRNDSTCEAPADRPFRITVRALAELTELLPRDVVDRLVRR